MTLLFVYLAIAIGVWFILRITSPLIRGIEARTEELEEAHEHLRSHSSQVSLEVEQARRRLAEEQARIRGELGEPAYDDGPYLLAGELLDRVVAAEELEEFLTLVAYDYLN